MSLECKSPKFGGYLKIYNYPIRIEPGKGYYVVILNLNERAVPIVQSGLARTACVDEIDAAEDERYRHIFQRVECAHAPRQGDNASHDGLHIVVHPHHGGAECALAHQNQDV